MRQAMLVVLGGLMILAACFISCDDETVVVGDGPDYFIIGDVLMRPYLELMGNIHPVHGQALDIDSIKFAGSDCEIIKSSYYIDGTNYNYGFVYRNLADSLRYGSGDIAPLHIYRGDEIVSAYIKLLKVPDDTVQIVSPAYDANFAVNSNITLVWDKVIHADWYSVTYIYDTSNVFDSDITYYYKSTTDTTFTIPSSDHPTDGVYYIFITSISGPVPGAAGNLESGSISGTVYSSAIPGVRMSHRLIIGSGIPTGAEALESNQYDNQTIIQKIMSDQKR